MGMAAERMRSLDRAFALDGARVSSSVQLDRCKAHRTNVVLEADLVAAHAKPLQCRFGKRRDVAGEPGAAQRDARKRTAARSREVRCVAHSEVDIPFHGRGMSKVRTTLRRTHGWHGSRCARRR
jgi:hypothetical protein